MYNFLKQADLVLHTYGAERVAVHNEMDRYQAKEVETNKKPISVAQLEHGEETNGKWIISSSMQAGTVYYSIQAKKLGYDIASGFLVSKWEYLHSKIAYYGKNPVNIKYGKKDSVYTNSITFKDSETTFKVNVFPYNYVLGNFDLGGTYTRMRFMVPVVDTIPCQITSDQLGKITKIGSAIGLKMITLEIKEGKLLARCGAKTPSADMGEIIICPVSSNTTDYIIGEIDIDKLYNLKVFSKDVITFNISGTCLYFHQENEEYDERLMLICKTDNEFSIKPEEVK